MLGTYSFNQCMSMNINYVLQNLHVQNFRMKNELLKMRWEERKPCFLEESEEIRPPLHTQAASLEGEHMWGIVHKRQAWKLRWPHIVHHLVL